VSAAYQTTPTPEAERFFAGLLRWAGVQAPVEVSGAQVEVRTLESGADTILFVFNHGKQPATAKIQLRGVGGSVHDLLAAKPGSLEVSLRGQDVAVLRIAKK
jgi:hypothetical protein